MSVTDAASSGDKHLALAAIRDNLAARLDDPDARDAAAVARQLVAVLELLGEKSEGTDRVDELRARRSARIADAKAAARTAKVHKPRK